MVLTNNSKPPEKITPAIHPPDTRPAEESAVAPQPPHRARWRSLLSLVSRPAHLRVILRDAVSLKEPVADSADHLKAAMEWLCRAQDVTGTGGVSAGYYLTAGWLPPYPETTGYIITTFLDYARRCNLDDYRRRAIDMGQWEYDIQLPSGGVRGQIGLNDAPIVFNTGQVILGWTALHRATGRADFLEAAERAGRWLIEHQDDDGAWRQCTHARVPHAYHSRVAWPILEISALTGTPAYRTAAEAFFRWLLSQTDDQGWFAYAGFTPDQHPYTHTIAYTLRGMLESAPHVEAGLREEMLAVVARVADTLLLYYERHKSDPRGLPKPMPGTFRPGYKGGETASCLTGNAQLAIVWMKLYRRNGDARFLNGALKILDQVKAAQARFARHPGIRGALPGACPTWGSYERFGYPNWATKFLADALMLEMEIMTGLEEGDS